MNIFIQDKSTQHGQGPELKLRPDINYSGYCILMIYLQRMTVGVLCDARYTVEIIRIYHGKLGYTAHICGHVSNKSHIQTVLHVIQSKDE